MSKLLCFMSMLVLMASCFRIPTSAEPGQSITLERYAKMPAIAAECSGLLIIDKSILVLNDGGNGPYLERLSMDGKDSLSSIKIDGVSNRDWEAITRYGDELIIGEFGNNLGNRKDLKLYHIGIKDYKLKETIPFSYPDQKTFERSRKHNFDCEGLVVRNDHYLLFSKNRKDKNSNIYKAPLHSGSFVFVDSISLLGAVTDVIHHAESDTYIVVCYEFVFGGFKSSLALVKEQSDGGFKTTSIFNLRPPEQFEAIVHLSDNRFLIGSEKGFGNGRHLYLVTIEGL